MKNSVLFPVVTIMAVGFLSCAGGNLTANRTFGVAGKLQQYCKSHDIQSPETSLADSLVKTADRSINKKKYNDAYLQSDLAGAYYKIAITRKVLNESESELSQVKNALTKEQEHLNSLKEVFNEIKALRKQ